MNRICTAILIATLAAGLAAPGVAEAKPKPLKEGQAAPKFRLRALDGAMVRLDELAYKGREKSYAKKRPILIDFFRTDCAPCMKSMPDLVKLHERYKAEGLHVMLIAILEEKDGRAKLQKYLDETKLSIPVVVDHSEHFAKKYLGDPVTLPATFLIDRDGMLRKIKYGASGTLEEHFGKQIKAVLAAHKEERG